jgi:hypothetical protein
MDELVFIASMWRDENDLIEIGNLDNELYEMDEICWHGWNTWWLIHDASHSQI